jgi:predicted MFS family arabinose efflux permease
MAVQSGLSSSDASFLISIVGISNSVGRVLSGWLADLRWTSHLGITIITTVAGLTYLPKTKC